MLRDSATADALVAIVDLDLATLADVEPPRGLRATDQRCVFQWNVNANSS